MKIKPSISSLVRVYQNINFQQSPFHDLKPAPCQRCNFKSQLYIKDIGQTAEPQRQMFTNWAWFYRIDLIESVNSIQVYLSQPLLTHRQTIHHSPEFKGIMSPQDVKPVFFLLHGTLSEGMLCNPQVIKFTRRSLMKLRNPTWQGKSWAFLCLFTFRQFSTWAGDLKCEVKE